MTPLCQLCYFALDDPETHRAVDFLIDLSHDHLPIIFSLAFYHPKTTPGFTLIANPFQMTFHTTPSLKLFFIPAQNDPQRPPGPNATRRDLSIYVSQDPLSKTFGIY